MIDRDPVRVEFLIQGLVYNPQSLYRAQHLRAHPSGRAKASRVMDWFEWGPTLSVLVQILNVLIMKNGGRSAASHTLKPPTERIVVRGGDTQRCAPRSGIPQQGVVTRDVRRPGLRPRLS